MTGNPVLIAGGGIGGLATALTLHQIGVPCKVLESVATPKPLGVGINIQPNGVRELYDMGISNRDLDGIGVRCRECLRRAVYGRFTRACQVLQP